MPFALMLFKLFSSWGLAVAEFLRKYWVQLLAIAFCLGIVYASYQWGYSSADTKWISANNEAVKALNKKITHLELMSKQDTEQYKVDVKILKDRIENILSETPTIVVHDADGKVMQCDNKAVKVYLGRDFKDAWNKINAESNK